MPLIWRPLALRRRSVLRLTGGATSVIVPPSQVLNVVGTDLRRRRAADEVLAGIAGVPGNQGALHYLTAYPRQRHRPLPMMAPTRQAPTTGRPFISLTLYALTCLTRPDVIAVGEPAVLQPTHAYQVGGFVGRQAMWDQARRAAHLSGRGVGARVSVAAEPASSVGIRLDRCRQP